MIRIVAWTLEKEKVLEFRVDFLLSFSQLEVVSEEQQTLYYEV